MNLYLTTYSNVKAWWSEEVLEEPSPEKYEPFSLTFKSHASRSTIYWMRLLSWTKKKASHLCRQMFFVWSAISVACLIFLAFRLSQRKLTELAGNFSWSRNHYLPNFANQLGEFLASYGFEQSRSFWLVETTRKNSIHVRITRFDLSVNTFDVQNASKT